MAYRCSATYAFNSVRTLTAVPDAGRVAKSVDPSSESPIYNCQTHDAGPKRHDVEVRCHDAHSRWRDAEARSHDAESHARDAQFHSRDVTFTRHDAGTKQRGVELRRADVQSTRRDAECPPHGARMECRDVQPQATAGALTVTTGRPTVTTRFPDGPTTRSERSKKSLELVCLQHHPAAAQTSRPE
jgi:hypothetical protein